MTFGDVPEAGGGDACGDDPDWGVVDAPGEECDGDAGAEDGAGALFSVTVVQALIPSPREASPAIA